MILSLTRDVIAIVPLTILLPLSMGIEGVLWATMIADTCGLVLFVIFMAIEMKTGLRRKTTKEDKKH